MFALTVVDHTERHLIGAFEVFAPNQTQSPPSPPPHLHHIGRVASDVLPGVFEHGRVSRQHLSFEVLTDATLRAIDLGSHNGTWVNDTKLTPHVACELSPGDVLRVGDALLLVHRRPPNSPRARHASIVGVGTGLGRVLREVDQVARHTTTVALIGETGVGKEVIAQALHSVSGRSGPIVALNCGGVSDNLLTSELFGHVRGAFTGADRRRPGLIETAKGGTLFLDEIMDASPGLQAMLLRLFETGEYRAVGSDHIERADVRFVVAAQPEIDERIADKRFRLDLWARLARWVIRIPPLRERREDIGALAHHFAERYAATPVRFAPDLMVALIRHSWPGNVRELQGLIERLVIAQRLRLLSKLELELDPSVFEQFVVAPPPVRPSASLALPTSATDSDRPRSRATERPTADALRDALRDRKGNVRATAQFFCVGRKTIYRWLEAHQIDVTETRDPDADFADDQ